MPQSEPAVEALFAAAFAMSIAFAAQPGVITFEATRRGSMRGWRAALQLELGSLVGDATWALIALLGASLLFQNRFIATGLSLFGCLLLLRFAWDAWQAAHAEPGPTTTQPTHVNDFAAGAMLSLSNPQNLTFWVGMSGTVVALGFLDPQPTHLLVFFCGFMLAQVCWCFFVAGLVGTSQRWLSPAVLRYVNLACAGFLALMGASLLFETVTGLVV